MDNSVMFFTKMICCTLLLTVIMSSIGKCQKMSHNGNLNCRNQIWEKVNASKTVHATYSKGARVQYAPPSNHHPQSPPPPTSEEKNNNASTNKIKQKENQAHCEAYYYLPLLKMLRVPLNNEQAKINPNDIQQNH